MKRTPLRRMGKDKARETAKYWPLRRKFIEDHPFCEFPVVISTDSTEDVRITCTCSCTERTTQIHHMKGQNWRVMNDTRYWMGLCAEHHKFIHDNHNKARTMGLILWK